jgi:hypothetical protein
MRQPAEARSLVEIEIRPCKREPKGGHLVHAISNSAKLRVLIFWLRNREFFGGSRRQPCRWRCMRLATGRYLSDLL